MKPVAVTQRSRLAFSTYLMTRFSSVRGSTPRCSVTLRRILFHDGQGPAPSHSTGVEIQLYSPLRAPHDKLRVIRSRVFRPGIGPARRPRHVQGHVEGNASTAPLTSWFSVNATTELRGVGASRLRRLADHLDHRRAHYGLGRAAVPDDRHSVSPRANRAPERDQLRRSAGTNVTTAGPTSRSTGSSPRCWPTMV